MAQDIKTFENTDVEDWDDFSLNQVGRVHLNFSSLDELKEELKYRGLPESLADFDKKNFNVRNGYIKNKYQSWSALAYPPM